MPAKKQDLTIEQGVNWSKGWLVTVEQEPIDDTWTARAQIRSKWGGLLHDFTADVTSEGAVVLSVIPAQSSLWKFADAVYDVEIVNEDESLTLRVAKGRVIVDREVTR